MDGLDRLIEMLEKRFGRFWADALLLLAVLGAASWGIHTFLVDFVVPGAKVLIAAYNWLAGSHIKLPQNFAAAIEWLNWGLVAFLGIGIPGVFIAQRVLLRRLRVVERSVDEDLAAHCHSIAMFQEREAGHLRTIKELEAKNAELTEAAGKLLALVQMKDGTPDSR